MILTFKKSLPLLMFLSFVLQMIIFSPVLANSPEQPGNPELFEAPVSPGQGVVGIRRGFSPGDGVSISTYPDTTFFLNGVFPIDDGGYVELPIYGKVRITQMTEADFTNYLLDKYKDYLRFPNIQVKPMIRLSVLGGVRKPGFYYFDNDYSLWEVMKLVGGTLDEDGLKQMRWKRDGDNVQEDLIPYIQSGVALKNISFRSGDQIWVRSPNKPGFFAKTRNVLNFVGALAGFFTLYITYQRYVIQGR